MFSGTDKTVKQAPAVQQRAVAPAFFRKAGEQESFFGAKQNPTFFSSPVQTKLTVSTPDDPQEREADAVADKVMRMQEPVAAAPATADKKEEKLDRKEEEVQPKAEAPLSDKIQCKQEPEQKLQAKACSCGGHDDHTHIQTKPDPAVSTPHSDSNISLYPSDVMRQSGRGPPEGSRPFEQTLASSKGGGSALPSDTRQFMESRIGADFSGVRIHTGVAAEGMSRSVNAQAFAHGSDIYFNSGKYSPGTSTGKILLAHELTHTVQQGASKSHTTDAAKQISRRGNNSSPYLTAPVLQVGQKDPAAHAGDSTGTVNRALPHPVLSNMHVNGSGFLLSSAISLSPEKELQQEHTKEKETAPDTRSGIQRKIFTGGKSSVINPFISIPKQQKGVSIQQKTATGKNFYVQRLPSLGEVWDATGGRVVSGAKAVGNFVEGVAEDVIEWTEDKLETLVNKLAPGLLAFLRSDILATIKQSISAAIDSLTGGLFSQMQTEGLAGILQQLFGTAIGSISDTASHACSAVADIAGKLWAFVKKLTGPALEGFKNMAKKLGGFFSSVWNDLALPAWDALKRFAGAAWQWIVDKANWLWDLLGPVRSAATAVWNWVKKLFGIAWGSAGSVLDWIKEKASAAWEWVKSLVQPIIGPLKIIGAILLMLSPAGPVILIYQGAPHIWSAIQWLAANFNKYVLSTAKEYLHSTILPAIQSGVQWIKGMIVSGFNWIKSGFDSILGGISSLLGAVAGLTFFRFLQGIIRSIMNGIRAALQSVAGAIGSLAAALAGIAGKIWEALKPIAEIVRQLVMVGILGPFAILDDGVWHTLNSIVQFGLRIPCVRELEGLLQVPWLMKQFDAFRKMMKGVFEMIKNPQPVIESIKKAIGGLVAKVAPKAKAAVALVLGSKNAHHLEGIMRHLEPKLVYLAAHWWEVVKETGWEMLWPWPAFGKDCEQIWIKGKSMFSHFFHLHFSKGIDDGLAIFRLLNSLAGHLYGWFAIASVLVGTIIGAFGGAGGGAVPGFWAGVAVAAEAGEVLLVGMLAAEGASIEKSVYDLGVMDQNEQEDEEDYEQISSSSMNLGIMGAMIVLGELAVKFGKSLLGSVKGLFRRRGAVPEAAPAIPGEVPKVEVDVPGAEPRTEVPEVKGETPEVRDLGTEGGKKVLAEEPTPDGHKVKVTEDGECLICSVCKNIREEFKSILEDPHPDAKIQELIEEFKKVEAIDGSVNPEAKAKAEVEIRQKLEKAAAEKSAAVHAQAEQLPTDIHKAYESAKKLPDNAPAKREILNKLEVLKEQAEAARELTRSEPAKAGEWGSELEGLKRDLKELEQKIKEIDPKSAVVEEPAYVKENRVPKANETVLADTARFERTGNNYQGQQIFREIDTGRAFHLDGLHKGASAEIEVFSGIAEGSPHLGTVTPQGAPLDGPITGRTLRISRN